jgi:hypothetical protein
MASLLGGGFTGEGGIPPDTTESVSMRKTWAVLGLLLRGRVGSTNDGIKSTMQALFKGKVGLTNDGIGSTTLALSLDPPRSRIKHTRT